MLLRIIGFLVLFMLWRNISMAQEIELKQDTTNMLSDQYLIDKSLKVIPLDSNQLPTLQKNYELLDKTLENMIPNMLKYNLEMPYYDPSETFRSNMPNANVIRDSVDYTLLIKPLPLLKQDDIPESQGKEK